MPATTTVDSTIQGLSCTHSSHACCHWSPHTAAWPVTRLGLVLGSCHAGHSPHHIRHTQGAPGLGLLIFQLHKHCAAVDHSIPQGSCSWQHCLPCTLLLLIASNHCHSVVANTMLHAMKASFCTCRRYQEMQPTSSHHATKEERKKKRKPSSTKYITQYGPATNAPHACSQHALYGILHLYNWLTKLPPALQDTCWQRAQRPHAKNTDTKDSGVRTPTYPPTANLTPNSCLPVVAMAGAP